jgi:parvulin-like peptidyl-prolyl isomerase
VRQDLRDQIRSEKFTQELAAEAAQPEPEEVEAYYREHGAEMIHPASVHASHIVKPVDPKNPQKTYHEMLRVRMELLDGADFTEVAAKDSSCEDPTGDLGTFSPGKMVEDFDTVVFSMTAGEISPIFRTEFGYHIVQVWDAHPERPMTREEAEGEITQILLQQRRDAIVADWISQKRNVAVIETRD